MHLPSIRVAIPTIFVLWCLAGLIAFGPVLLFYPAMWAGVGLFFVIIHFAMRSSGDNHSDTSSSTE